MPTYELWQTRTRNLIGAFATEKEALAVVRRAVRAHGTAYIDTVLLGREDDEGHSSIVAQGKGLLELAHRETSGRAVGTAELGP